jgi:hypothetical protein
VTVPGAGVPPDAGAAARAARRRRLIPALVGLDAVLVAAVLVVVLLVTHPGGSAAPAASGTGTGAQVAGGTGAHTPTPTPGPPAFRLPSGNIGCEMTAGGVTCTIASETFTPPPGAACDGGTTGHTVVLDAHGVSMPCVRGTPTSVAGQAPVLNYGGTSTVGPYTCTSATNGVTCTTAQGVGFRLAREALVTLP